MLLAQDRPSWLSKHRLLALSAWASSAQETWKAPAYRGGAAEAKLLRAMGMEAPTDVSTQATDRLRCLELPIAVVNPFLQNALRCALNMRYSVIEGVCERGVPVVLEGGASGKRRGQTLSHEEFEAARGLPGLVCDTGARSLAALCTGLDWPRTRARCLQHAEASQGDTHRTLMQYAATIDTFLALGGASEHLFRDRVLIPPDSWLLASSSGDVGRLNAKVEQFKAARDRGAPPTVLDHLAGPIHAGAQALMRSLADSALLKVLRRSAGHDLSGPRPIEGDLASVSASRAESILEARFLEAAEAARNLSERGLWGDILRWIGLGPAQGASSERQSA